jgi:hypothetical protein
MITLQAPAPALAGYATAERFAAPHLPTFAPFANAAALLPVLAGGALAFALGSVLAAFWKPLLMVTTWGAAVVAFVVAFLPYILAALVIGAVVALVLAKMGLLPKVNKRAIRKAIFTKLFGKRVAKFLK